MDSDIDVNVCEGVPLQSPIGETTYLETDETVIHVETEKLEDIGVHVNTTFSIESSKKIKVLFIMNILFSIVCMLTSCSVTFYYWKDMRSMYTKVEMVREQIVNQNFKEVVVKEDKPVQDLLIMTPRSLERAGTCEEYISPNALSYHPEELGKNKAPLRDIGAFQKGSLVVHFNGALREVNMGSEAIVGPWRRDMDVSTKGSESKIELHTNYFVIQESGLYIVYTQIVYITKTPSCYFVWARQPDQEPRLLSTCATGDDMSSRAPLYSQVSCGTYTLARLYKGDSVNIAQREHNKTLWLRPGFSYFGFIKINE